MKVTGEAPGPQAEKTLLISSSLSPCFFVSSMTSVFIFGVTRASYSLGICLDLSTGTLLLSFNGSLLTHLVIQLLMKQVGLLLLKNGQIFQSGPS